MGIISTLKKTQKFIENTLFNYTNASYYIDIQQNTNVLSRVEYPIMSVLIMSYKNVSIIVCVGIVSFKTTDWCGRLYILW